MKQPVVIRLKSSGPIQTYPASTYPEDADSGQIRFDEISSDGINTKTWQGHVRYISSFYPKLDLPDKEIFYWETLSEESTINKLIELIIVTYQVQDGENLAAKLTPFRSMVFRINSSVTAISRWGEAIINARRNYEQIVRGLGIEHITGSKSKLWSDNQIDGSDWVSAYLKLQQTSTDKSTDPRVRVLATIYKYGYVLRIPTIFNTCFKRPLDTDRKYHYLDLINRVWTIDRLQFKIPDSMAAELIELTNEETFRYGWILPQRRGTPYATQASVSSFSSWSKSGLKLTSYYRNIYNVWLKSKVTESEYLTFQQILSPNPSAGVITYLPPIPAAEQEPLNVQDNPPP